MINSVNGTCSLSGSFYICPEATPYFAGCCKSDPCNSNGCPTTDFFAAGLAAGNMHLDTSDIVCTADSLFYTCEDTNPTFQGCCVSNPCQDASGGCPADDLRQMQMLHSQADSTATSLAATSVRTTSSLNAPTSSTAFNISSSPHPPTSTTSSTSPNSTSEAKDDHQDSMVPAIAGGISGAIFLVLFVALLLCWQRRRYKHRYQSAELRHTSTGPFGTRTEPFELRTQDHDEEPLTQLQRFRLSDESTHPRSRVYESPRDIHSFVEMSGSVTPVPRSPDAAKHKSTAVSMVSALTSATELGNGMGSPRSSHSGFVDEIESVDGGAAVELPDESYAQRHW